MTMTQGYEFKYSPKAFHMVVVATANIVYLYTDHWKMYFVLMCVPCKCLATSLRDYSDITEDVHEALKIFANHLPLCDLGTNELMH